MNNIAVLNGTVNSRFWLYTVVYVSIVEFMFFSLVLFKFTLPFNFVQFTVTEINVRESHLHFKTWFNVGVSLIQTTQ